jgi:hypothetical protein
MAQGKFAAITSSLLARKGEAAPWLESGRTPLAWRNEIAPAMPPPPPPASPAMIVAAPPAYRAPLAQAPSDTLKRCTVRLSQDDYERLGLMAVKKDVTRQQLLQAALAEVVAGMAREFSQGCACIGAGCGNACGGKSSRAGA